MNYKYKKGDMVKINPKAGFTDYDGMPDTKKEMLFLSKNGIHLEVSFVTGEEYPYRVERLDKKPMKNHMFNVEELIPAIKNTWQGRKR